MTSYNVPSLGIRLPKEIATSADLRAGALVRVRLLDNGSIIVVPLAAAVSVTETHVAVKQPNIAENGDWTSQCKGIHFRHRAGSFWKMPAIGQVLPDWRIPLRAYCPPTNKKVVPFIPKGKGFSCGREES